MIGWPDIYLQHFSRFFGKPFDVETYRQDDGSALRLATFDPIKLGRIYASLGLSEHAATLKDLGEVILIADDKGKDIPFLFVNALCFIVQKRIPLGSHFAIGGVRRTHFGLPRFTIVLGDAAAGAYVESGHEARRAAAPPH